MLATGRTGLYLSGRTAWLVPLGGVLATVAAGLRLASARTARPERLGAREAWTLGLIVLPVVVLLAMPPATLGTYAAGRRSGFVGSGVSAGERLPRLRSDHPDRRGRRAVIEGRAGGARSGTRARR